MSWLFTSDVPAEQRPTSPLFQAFSRGFNGPSQQGSDPDSAGRQTPTSPKVEDPDKKKAPSFRLDTAMNDFITAVQSDLEVGLGELKEASVGMGAMFTNLKDKVAFPTKADQATKAMMDPEEILKREEARRVLQAITLEGGGLHTCTITAVSNGRVVGGVEDKYIRLEWYRALPGGSFTAIHQVKGGVYKPSADDIGARICLRGTLASGGEEGEDEAPLSIFGEVGPLAMDPEVEADYVVMAGEKTAAFSGLRDPKFPSRSYELVLDAQGLMLMRGEEENSEGEGEGDGEELVGRWALSARTRVAVHAASMTVLAIEVPRHQEGEHSPGDGSVCRRVLVCNSRRQRDVLVLLWRSLRREAMQAQGAEEEGVNVEVDDATLQQAMDELLPDMMGPGGEEGQEQCSPSTMGADDPSHGPYLSDDHSHSAYLSSPDNSDSQAEPSSTCSSSASTQSKSPAAEEGQGPIQGPIRGVAVRGPTTTRGEGEGEREKRRAASDSQLLYIDPGWRPTRPTSTAVGSQGGPGGECAQMEALAAGLEGTQWARLQGHEKQIAQLSNQLALSTVQLEHERGLRTNAEERAQREGAAAARLRSECVALQARVAYLERAALKSTVEHSEAKAQALDSTTRAEALMEELERTRLSEQALLLKVSTNEEAAKLMREEVGDMNLRLQQLQEQKEKERRYLVSDLQDRSSRLDKADAAIIQLEHSHKELQAQYEQSLSQATSLRAEVTSLRAESLSQATSLRAEVTSLRAEVASLQQADQALGDARRELQELREQWQETLANSRHAHDALETSHSQLGSLQSELEGAQARAALLLTERNSYRHKAESLSREMHRLTQKMGLSGVEEIEEMLNRLPLLEAEKKRLVEELDELRDIKGLSLSLSTTTTATGGPTGGPTGGGAGALNSAGSAVKAFFRQASNPDIGKDQAQVGELQRLVSSLTDALHDRDTALGTQRDMNRRLLERVARLEALVREKGGAFSGDDEEEEEEEDSSDESGGGSGGGK